MRTVRTRSRIAAFVGAIMLLLPISPGLAAGDARLSTEGNDSRRGIEVTFTKWVTDFPNMAGLVSGDVGGGLFAGEILNVEQTGAITRIEALYHVRGGDRRFTARVHVVQNNETGTAAIRGVVMQGAFRGQRVRGEYQVIAPCGIINAQNGSEGDVCFQGTLGVGPDND